MTFTRCQTEIYEGNFYVKTILHHLYTGEFSEPTKERQDRLHEFNVHFQDFMEKLDPLLWDELIDIIDEHSNSLSSETSEIFADGFRLGAKMMLEILKDDI